MPAWYSWRRSPKLAPPELRPVERSCGRRIGSAAAIRRSQVERSVWTLLVEVADLRTTIICSKAVTEVRSGDRCLDRRGTRESAVAGAQDDRSLVRPDRLDRGERKRPEPPWRDAAATDDDLVRVVGVSLVADVIEPPNLRPVTRNDAVTGCVGEQTAELRLPPQALLEALVIDPVSHVREGSDRPPLAALP
jgi:hypothetical protein